MLVCPLVGNAVSESSNVQLRSIVLLGLTNQASLSSLEFGIHVLGIPRPSRRSDGVMASIRKFL